MAYRGGVGDTVGGGSLPSGPVCADKLVDGGEDKGPAGLGDCSGLLGTRNANQGYYVVTVHWARI